MRKILLLCLFLCTGRAEAWRTNEKIAPWTAYSTRTTEALDVYVTNTATLTVANVYTYTSSMTINVTKGADLDYTFQCLYTNYPTNRDVISWGSAITTVTVNITHPSPLFADDTTVSTELSNTSTANCLGVANTVTLSVDNTLGFSYVKAAEQGKRQYVQGFDCNATFGTGTTLMTIYDGIYTSSTTKKVWEVEATAAGEDMPIKGVVRGSPGNAMRFDVAGSSWVSAGWMNIEGYSK